MTTEEKEILAAKLEEQKIDVIDYSFILYLSIISVYLLLFVF